MTASFTNARWLTDAPARLLTTIASLASLALVVGAGVFVAASHTTVTLEADGVTRPVSLWGRTVADAVRASGVEVGPHDVVSPALGSDLREGQNIEIDRARRLTISSGEGTRDFWTTASDLSGALEDLAASGRSGTITASRSYVRGELPTLATTGTPITVVADGEEHQVDAGADMTVPGALEAAGVSVSPIDRVLVSGSADAVRIEVIRVERGNTTATEEIAYEVEKRANDDLYEGETRVVTKGQPGKIVTTRYQQKRGDDVLVDVLVSRDETKPVTQVEEYGTRKRPATPAPSKSGGGAAVGGDVWAALARCESGGNPATNTGNGYYGMYQFSLGTWRSVGGTGLPSEASAAEQTMRAQILQKRGGWGQWPACSAQLGLR